VKGTAEACDRKNRRTDGPTTGMCEPDESKQETRGKKVSSLYESLKDVYCETCSSMFRNIRQKNLTMFDLLATESALGTGCRRTKGVTDRETNFLF
jgi:hypothetical protein